MRVLKTLLLIGCCSFFIEVQSQVGINTITPLSTLDVNGNLSVKVVNLTGSAAPTDISDGIYISLIPLVTDQVFRLPDPVLYPGRMYVVRNIQNFITAALTTSNGLLFFKGTTTGTGTIYMYENNNRTLIVISDGNNWTVFN